MKKTSRVARIVLVALGVVLMSAAVVPMVIPISTAGSVSRRDLAGPESRFVRLEGIEIHHEASSAELGRQAFVLLHGFGASTYSWREVVEPLSEIAPVIAFDRPTFGLTERPMQWRGDSPYGPDAQILIVLARRIASSGDEFLRRSWFDSSLVTDDTDRIVLTEQSVKLASDLPNARLVVIPESGHVAHEETPVPFMEAVRGFIAGHGLFD